MRQDFKSEHPVPALPEVPPASELEIRLQGWSRHWRTEEGNLEEDQRRVNERLRTAVQRFFGRHALRHLILEKRQPLMPLAAPLFTAFLGRRATRELSRRVLADL